MKPNFLKLMTVALLLAGCFLACTKNTKIDDTKEEQMVYVTIEDENSGEETQYLNNEKDSLVSTKWKLAGIVDTSTNELMVLEPKYLDDFYTLMFDTDSTISGKTTLNIVSGTYTANYVTNSIIFTDFGGTKLGELGDGNLWWAIFPTIRNFSLQENELRLYYNSNKNYLLFKSNEKTDDTTIEFPIDDKNPIEMNTIRVFIDEPAIVHKKHFDHLGRAEGFYFVIETKYPELPWYGVVPIGEIPEQCRKVGLSVKISGNVTDRLVGNGVSEPHIRLAAINLFELKSIKLN